MTRVETIGRATLYLASCEDVLGNLRSVGAVENARNMAASRRNKSGVTGVAKRDGRWRAHIGNRHLGTFPTLETAAAARREAERLAGYHPNHGREAFWRAMQGETA